MENETVLNEQVLKVEGLNVSLKSGKSWTPIVKDAHLTIKKGRALGLIGESGCGKSVSCMSILGLLTAGKWSVEGSIKLRDQELLRLNEGEMKKIRGSQMATIMQNPMNAFNPLLKIRTHFIETLRTHKNITAQAAIEEAVQILTQIGFDDPAAVMNKYPFQCSGGMLQRVMIGIALAMQPALIVADEPTTALDVTIQYQILKQLSQLKEKTEASILLVTHDLGVAAALADDIAVMYNGFVIEQGTTAEILNNPRHPYTQALMSAKPGFQKKRLSIIQGVPPRMGEDIKGCPFAPRCSEKKKVCSTFDMRSGMNLSGHVALCANC